MIAVGTITTRAIRAHYDLATPFYRLLWGPHIHHGLWDADETPSCAQLQLTELLARKAGLRAGERVLEVGCGMGGTALHLTREYDCTVLGLTLSSVQRAWAMLWARASGMSARVRFQRQDAERVRFPAASFDVIWSMECTEHLFDKAGFFQRAATWLRPGGRFALCAWIAGVNTDDVEAHQQVRAVCEGFLCPSLGTAEDYRSWFEVVGCDVLEEIDLTAKVARTWEICDRRMRRTGVRWLARLAGRELTCFVDRFETLLQAYRSGAMQYGLFVARKSL